MKFDIEGSRLSMDPAESRSLERPMTLEQQVEQAARNLYGKFKEDGTLNAWERLLGEVREEWKDTRDMSVKDRRARREAIQKAKEDALKNRDPQLVETKIRGMLDDPDEWSSDPSFGGATEDRRFAVSLIWHRLAERLREDGHPTLFRVISKVVNEWYG